MFSGLCFVVQDSPKSPWDTYKKQIKKLEYFTCYCRCNIPALPFPLEQSWFVYWTLEVGCTQIFPASHVLLPNLTLFKRVQKKLRLHGSEPEEDLAFYVVFQEGLVICTNNPVSAKFSVMISTVKDIALLPYNFSRHAQCRVRELWLVLIFLIEEGL